MPSVPGWHSCSAFSIALASHLGTLSSMLLLPSHSLLLLMLIGVPFCHICITSTVAHPVSIHVLPGTFCPEPSVQKSLSWPAVFLPCLISSVSALLFRLVCLSLNVSSVLTPPHEGFLHIPNSFTLSPCCLHMGHVHGSGLGVLLLIHVVYFLCFLLCNDLYYVCPQL